jgi:ribonucleoside-diphosphate reductase beta chain
MSFIEPLIDPSQSVFIYVPNDNNPVQQNLLKQRNAQWTYEEVRESIMEDHNKLDKVDKTIMLNIKRPLLFLSIGDKLISDNLSVLMRRIQKQDVINALAFQNMMETTVHAPCYSLMVLPWLGEDKNGDLIREIESSNIFLRKKEFMTKYFTKKIPVGKQLLAALINEGIFFSSSFCYIDWVKEHGYLPGIAKVNEFISRDELMHAELIVIIIKYILVEKPSVEEVYEIFREGVEIEIDYAKYCIQKPTADLTWEMMSDYIMSLADSWIEEIGYGRLYNKTNPLSYSVKRGMNRIGDFFIGLTTEYKHISAYNMDGNICTDDL